MQENLEAADGRKEASTVEKQASTEMKFEYVDFVEVPENLDYLRSVADVLLSL